ncbi:DUF7533 family protein [Natronomonas sp.]|uniref:DUF7533 family protein n=1 Tax=Natronomonas sp. TaxID=2184060 RepID=UPI00262EE74C|nr:hypothetical protein [Natronomonas sp.]
MNVLDTLTLFGTVALAAPIGLLGAEFLVGDRPLAGIGFLAVAAALVAGGYFRPGIGSVVGALLAGGDESADGGEDDGGDGGNGSESESGDGETYTR